MKAKRKLRTVIEEAILALCTVIMMIPIYYLVIGAFKKRTDIVKFPLTINADIFTLENFPYVIKKMDYWKALGNTMFITVMALVIVIICASLAGFAIARIRSRIFSGYYNSAYMI